MSHEREKLYYDGHCPLCTAVAQKISISSEQEHFDLKDVHTEEVLPFAKEEHLKEIVLTGPKGTVRGAEALLTILERYPRWRWVARIGRVRAVKPLLATLYRFIASNRYLLSRFATRKRRVY